jgi:Domain of unknown function (DUF4168)
MRYRIWILPICLVALGLALALSVLRLPNFASSQNKQISGTNRATTSSGSQTISAVVLQHAARAYIVVRDVTFDTDQQLARTTDESQQKEIVARAEAKTLDAIREEGLEPQEYDMIVTLVNSEPDLHKKFLGYVHAARGA